MDREDELEWLPEPEELEHLMMLDIEDIFLEDLLWEDEAIPLGQKMEDEDASPVESKDKALKAFGEPHGEVDLQKPCQAETANEKEENPEIDGALEHNESPTVPEASEVDSDV